MTTIALVMLVINSIALAVAMKIMSQPHGPNTIPLIALGVVVFNVIVWLIVEITS